jgi:hypothetical protein
MLARFRQGTKAALWRNRWLLGLIGLHWALTLLVAQALGMVVVNSAVQVLAMLFGTVIPVFMLVLLVWHLVQVARLHPGTRPLPRVLADLRTVATDYERLLGGAIALVALSVFFNNFSTLKEAVPLINPFGWDVAFAQLDRALHAGIDPWRLLWPMFGHPWMITALNGAYILWLFLIYFMVFVACFTRTNPVARDRFLAAFVLTWAIGGNALAAWFSSAGPVYYAALGLGDTFEPLMAALRSAQDVSPVPSLKVQDMLWAGYVKGDMVSGISAMPSMHVASSVLMMLYAYSYAQLAGRLMAVFLAMILIASVVLGWHYAADGYAGVLIAWGCWVAAGRGVQISPRAQTA